MTVSVVGMVIRADYQSAFAAKRTARGQDFTVMGFGLKDGACPTLRGRTAGRDRRRVGPVADAANHGHGA
jgi:hypothetical protein